MVQPHYRHVILLFATVSFVAAWESTYTYDMISDINENINYYDVLGIDGNAEKSDIKRAYRKLSMIYHPDKNKDESDEDTYLIITRAYSVLSDEEMRQEYDDYLTNGIPWMAQYDTYMNSWGAPKHDIKVVILWTLLIVSIGKYLIEYQNHATLLERAKKSRFYQIRYNEWLRNGGGASKQKGEKKKKKKVLGNDQTPDPEFVIEIKGSRFPTWKDVVIVQFFSLPIAAGEELFSFVLEWILYFLNKEIPQMTSDEIIMLENNWSQEELERKKKMAVEKGERMKFSARAKRYRRWKKQGGE